MLIEEGWQSYEQLVVPANASEVQRAEARRAFYGGARTVFHGLANALSEGEEAEEEDMVLMDDIQAELDQFRKDVEAGKA